MQFLAFPCLKHCGFSKVIIANIYWVFTKSWALAEALKCTLSRAVLPAEYWTGLFLNKEICSGSHNQNLNLVYLTLKSLLLIIHHHMWQLGSSTWNWVVPWTQIDRVWGECRFGEVLVRAWPWGSQVEWGSLRLFCTRTGVWSGTTHTHTAVQGQGNGCSHWQSGCCRM